MDLKNLRNLDLKQQLLFCESYLPDAWEYLNDAGQFQLPQFDDNDELITKKEEESYGKRY